MRQKILCLDIGAKILGVAVSDAFGTMAFPRDEIAWGGSEAALAVALRRFEQEEGAPSLVVLGVPPKAAPAMQEALQKVTALLAARGWSTAQTDEHVSTQEAANRIADAEEETGMAYPRARRDSVAAQIILERYLSHS